MSGAYRVLYVDDEPDLLEITKIFLESSSDFSVETIDSAPAALNLLKSEQFDAIISDYQMPGMDGIEFLKVVRNAGDKVPFIIFTGKGREEIVIQAINEGADFYLQKGGEPESQFAELVHKVKLVVEQRRAKESFHKSEERLRLIFDSSKDSLYSYDMSGRFTSVNRNLCNEMGLLPDQIVGKTHGELGFPAELCEEWEKLHQQVYATNTSVIAETQATMADGKIHQYTVILNPIHNSHGTIIGISGTTRDITERKRTEEALRINEEKYRTLFESMATGVFYQMADGTLVDINPAALRMFGLTYNQFTGRDSYDPRWKVITEDGAEVPPEQHPSLIALKTGKKVINTIFGVYNPELEGYTWVIINAEPQFRPGEEKPFRVYVTMNDITGRKQAEEQLKLSEWRQRLALQIGQIGTFEVDLESGNGILSDELAEAWGIPDNFTGNFVEYCWDHTHPDDLLRIREEFARATESHAITDMEFRIITPDGEVRWISWKGEVYSDPRTGRKLAAGVNMDITGRKRSEEEVKQKNEEMNAAYEQLVGSEEELRQNYMELTSIQRALQESEEKFRTVAEFTYDWEYWISPTGEILYTSPSCEKISGYTVEELTADPTLLERMVHEDDRPIYNTHYSRLTLERDTIHQIDFRIRTKDGLERWIGHVCNPVYGRDGIYRGRRACNRDITERKQAQEELKQSEKRYRLLADNSTDVIWTLGLDGSFIYVSPSVLQLRGYTPDEVMHQTLDEVISPGSLPIVQEMIQKTLEKVKSGIVPPTTTVEVEQPCKDGSSVWTEVVSRLLYDSSGKPEGFIGVSRNISERKRAEALVESNQRLLQAVIDNSQYLIYAKDLKGRFIMVSQSLADLFGHPREQIMGKTSYDFLPKAIADQHCANDLEVLAQKSPVNSEEIVETADGIHTYLSTKFPLSDTDGTIYAVCGASIDITGRKQREEELKLKNFAIESSINAIAFTSLTGNITYVNPAFLSIMGYEDLSEVLNKSVISFWTSPDGSMIFEAIQTLGHWSGEITGKRKNGTPIHAQVSINLIHDASGKPVGLMGSFVDITERIRAQDSLLKVNQKLHVLSQLTREDLNNKIMVLNSYLDLVKIQLKRQEPVFGTLQKLDEAVEQIQRINEYSKDYQDMGVKPPKWQNLKTVMLLGLSHMPRGNFQHILETGNLEIFADPLLEKVCQQFFENSLMHGKQVTRIRIWHTITPDRVTIFYEDNGIGIPRAMKEQIFLRDISSRSSRNSLIFAREILDITGVTIKETGEPGKGVRFEMYVPEGAYRFGV